MAETSTTDLLTLRWVRAQVSAGTARAARLAAGLTVAEVASAANVASRSVMRWEAGQRWPHGAAALRYGEVLETLMRSQR